MENIFIAIVTNDKEYARSLSLGMLNVCRGFIIRIFTAEEFLAAGREYDLVLWDGDEVSQVYGGRIIYLAEKPSDVVENMADKRFSIYKYSTAATLVAAIFEIYEALTGRRAVNLRKQDVRLFAFVSCSGGAGCTTAAMSVAQEMCRFYGSKVLYLSFEELDSSVDYFKNEAGVKGAAVYLYELFGNINKEASDKKPAVFPFLERHVVRDDFGVESFAPSEGRNPLRELNVSEIRTFLSSLIDSSRYDAIIMDLGSWLSKTGLKCLEMAEKISFIRDHSNPSMREEHYFNHVMYNLGEEVLNKIIKVSNRSDKTVNENEPDKYKYDTEDKQLTLSVCENITKEKDHIRLSLEGAFGEDIGKITERMTEPAESNRIQ